MVFNEQLRNREAIILEALIREYLRSGAPIGSKVLYQKRRLNLSPSTIRHYFYELTQRGFLIQPHISSGRVPTEKAWQIFVAQILNNFDLMTEMERKMKQYIQMLFQEEEAITIFDLINILSQKAKAFGLGYFPKTDEIYKAGYSYLFEIDSANYRDLVEEIAEDLDHLDHRLKEFQIENYADEPLVFIGSDNPFFSTNYLSALVMPCLEDDGYFGLIGPNRILKEQNIALIKAAGLLVK